MWENMTSVVDVCGDKGLTTTRRKWTFSLSQRRRCLLTRCSVMLLTFVSHHWPNKEGDEWCVRHLYTHNPGDRCFLSSYSRPLTGLVALVFTTAMCTMQTAYMHFLRHIYAVCILHAMLYDCSDPKNVYGTWINILLYMKLRFRSYTSRRQRDLGFNICYVKCSCLVHLFYFNGILLQLFNCTL